ncbi:hypothetical protein P3S68_015097 [Capsicum galapagoense]
MVSSEVGCLIVLDRDIKLKLRGTTDIDIDELCLYLVIFFLSVYVDRTLQKYQQVRVGFSKRSVLLENPTRRYFVSVLMGAKRTRLHGESDDWKKFPIPPGLESPMSFTFVAVGNESEQDPSQAASTSTIISIGKLKSSVRCRPWILDDHVDHMEEDSGCEADKLSWSRLFHIQCIMGTTLENRRCLCNMEVQHKERMEESLGNSVSILFFWMTERKEIRRKSKGVDRYFGSYTTEHLYLLTLHHLLAHL